MRQLRSMTTWVAALSFVLAIGCDTGPDPDTDSGVVRVDAGPTTGTDSGPMTGTDAGPMTGTDAGPTDGGGGGMCTGPAMGDCNLIDPTSCGTGMACVFSGSSTTSWTTQCIMAGVGGQGDTCTMQGQCQEGFVCTNRGICQKVCCATPDCDTGDFCGNIAGLNAGTCATPIDCDLVAQTGCEGFPGTGCYPGAGGLDCIGAGTLNEGEVCMFTNDCMPGMGCLGPMGGPSNCRRWCDMSAADPCPAGFTCGGVTGLPVGACQPM